MSGRGAPAFKVISDERRNSKKFKTDSRWTTLEFRRVIPGEDVNRYLEEIFTVLLNYLLQQQFAPHDGLDISDSARRGQKTIGISVRRTDQLNVEVILQTIQRVLQSNGEFLIEGNIEVC